MNPPESTIESQFHSDSTGRSEALKRARLCAALSKPWVCPPESQGGNTKLPENYQSTGSRGVSNLEGKLLLALWPPGVPWFKLNLTAEAKYDPDAPPEMIQEFEYRLFLYELLILAQLESSQLEPERKRRSGFRTHKRKVLSQLLVTGDALEHLTDDYALKLFRRDQYVTCRDSSGDVLYHIIRENVDPFGLPDKIRERAISSLGTKIDNARTVKDRMQDIYTRVEWQPLDGRWMIEQEMNGKIISQPSLETINPFISTSFELSPGENYGRGLCELNIGDLKSLDTLNLRLIEFAAMASKHLAAIDNGGQTREEDLKAPSGSVFRAKVRGGRIDDVAFMSIDKVHDFTVVERVAGRIQERLDKAFLVESEIQPTGDRVTKFQVQRIAAELEGALGGVYATIADEQQMPLLRRLIHLAEKDRLLPRLPDNAVEIQALTGISALARDVDANKIFSAFQALSSLGETTLSRIDPKVATDLVLQHLGIYEPGLIKSEEQLAAEQNADANRQLQLNAGQQAISTTGKMAEKQAESYVTESPN